jgi:hypothetical protein
MDEGHGVRRPRERTTAGALIALLLCLTATPAPAPAAQEPSVQVILQNGQSLRDLAAQHLGDPNLWTEILRASGLASIADARPGVRLRIPAAAVSRANRALAAALGRIQAANEAGAKVFAPEEIDRAVRLHEQAQARRGASDWDSAAGLSGEAGQAADAALKLALKARDAAAEALLSDRYGWVEGRRPRELDWTDRPVRSVLAEEERVRTLSQSTAQITFRDESRLRLSANSEAVILRMRADPLERTQEAKVNLIEGDFYALLAGKNRRSSFELEVPDVQTRIDSTSFWVERDRRGAKFTNYDDATLEVAARGASVELGRNEGTVVRTGEAPSDKVAVLPGPALLAPDDNGTIFNAASGLSWSGVGEATGYWLEIGLDPGFLQVADNRWGLQQTHHETAGLAIGSYYWRVAALDKFGLPGERSEVRRFHVRTDTVPPYLVLAEPSEGAVLRQPDIRVTGTTEPDAVLTVAGVPVTPAADGRFETPLEPREGVNEVTFEARDRAGNVTRRTRAFVYTPAGKVVVNFDENLPRLGLRHFVTNRSPLMLAGSTVPEARIGIRSVAGPLRASTFTDGGGRFGLTVPLAEAHEAMALTVTVPNGVVTEESFEASIDQEPPRIALDEPPPAVTSVEWLPLAGQTEPGAALVLNGRPVVEADGRFEERVKLAPGRNSIEMLATDRVGNVAIERWTIDLDQEPPDLVASRIEPARLERGGRLTVEVVASDPSGLRQAAPVTIAVGPTVYTDYLRLSEATQTYRGTFTLSADARGPAVLKDVLLEDYVGNGRHYRSD